MSRGDGAVSAWDGDREETRSGGQADTISPASLLMKHSDEPREEFSCQNIKLEIELIFSIFPMHISRSVALRNWADCKLSQNIETHPSTIAISACPHPEPDMEGK